VTDQLILVVTEHRPFGWKINLYSALFQSDDSIRVLGLPNKKEEIERGASDDVIALLKSAEETSDQSLLKAYSREKDKTKIAQTTIDNLIRPRIEKNCTKMLRLALQANIPIFFREIHGSRIIFTSTRLEILPEPSRCLFNFIKDETGLRYYITLTNDDEEIALQQEPAIVLSDDPCVVLLGKKIHRVENIDSKKLLPFFTKTHIQVPAHSEKLYIQKFILKTIPLYDVRIEGIEMEEKHPERTAVLVLGEDFYSRLVFSLFFQYGNQRLIPTTKQRKRRVVMLEETNGMQNIAWFDRDLAWENDRLIRIIDLGLFQDGENRFYLKQQSETLQRYSLIGWMNQNLDKLSEFRIEQKAGFYWLDHLRKMNFGGCLADDMGLGKTIQTIALLESAYSQDVLPASLVVAPTSLLHNWQNELKKFAPGLKSYIYAGYKRKQSDIKDGSFDNFQVIITSYGIVRSDCESLANYPFYYLILDESQFIKNPDSFSYHAVKQLSSKHRLALTGTPIENSLTDLWAQFNFINPDMLGNLFSFRNNYINKIVRDKDQKVEAALQRMIQPFLLRRTKEEVTPELPLLTQEIVYCDMTEEQEKTYSAEKNSIRNQMLENEEFFLKNNIIALQSLLRLRLLSNHPLLMIPEYTGDSGKFDQILIYFESIKTAGHKVLIFSSFLKYIRLLTKAFDEREWNYALLTGETGISNREEEIARFNEEPDINAFFISLKAGGTGLNLTAADYVFIVDPWWNPAAEMQALSRAHRIGQDKPVMVYRFISSDSIEEKIIALQNKKSQLSDTFVSSNNPLKQMNFEEIEHLFE